MPLMMYIWFCLYLLVLFITFCYGNDAIMWLAGRPVALAVFDAVHTAVAFVQFKCKQLFTFVDDDDDEFSDPEFDDTDTPPIDTPRIAESSPSGSSGDSNGASPSSPVADSADGVRVRACGCCTDSNQFHCDTIASPKYTEHRPSPICVPAKSSIETLAKIAANRKND